MNKFLFILLFIPAIAKSQLVIPEILGPVDTVRAYVMASQKLPESQLRVFRCYVVRQAFMLDRLGMPSGETPVKDRWNYRVIGYLDARKTPFNSSFIIWNYKLIDNE